MARAKATAKHVAAFVRRRDLLKELLDGPLSVLVLKARGDYAFASNLAADGFLHLGTDVCSLSQDGREWLKEIAR